MSKWSSQYLSKSAETELRPVYAMIVCEDWTYARPGDSFLEDAVGVSETSIQLASDGDIELENGDTLLIYDKDGFEFLVATSWTQGTQLIGTATRGQYGTIAKPFDRGAVVAKPLAYFATQSIQGTTLPFTIGMQFPSGGGQSIDMRESRTTVDDIIVTVQDADGSIPRYFKRKPIIGLRAIVMGGYEGMVLENFSFLGIGNISALEVTQANIYQFTIESIMAQLKVKLFGDIEDFTATLTSNITSSSGTFGLSPDASSAYLNSAAQTMSAIGGWLSGGELLKCGIVYKIDNEYILAAGGTGTTITVAIDGRGYWDTVAASHSAGAAIDMLFGYEGHPIDFLIGLLLTKQSETDNLAYQRTDQAPGLYYDWRAVVDIDKDPLAIGLQFGDIEIDTFLDIRNRWFIDYVFRYQIAKRLDMENFIPKHLLSPLGLALYVNRAGKLALMIMQPPLNASAETVDKDDIVGIPSIRFTSDDVVNAVLVKYDYDGAEFATESRLIDAASQVTYQRKDEIELEVVGLDTDWRGEQTAERIARRKIRPIKDPNPILAVDVLFSRSSVEMGQIISINHPDLPDVLKGTVGWEKSVMVIGKTPVWEDGSLRWEIMDANYFGKRYGLIARAGESDYLAASDEVKSTYCFISDDVTEAMSNGDQGYQVM